MKLRPTKAESRARREWSQLADQWLDDLAATVRAVDGSRPLSTRQRRTLDTLITKLQALAVKMTPFR